MVVDLKKMVIDLIACPYTGECGDEEDFELYMKLARRVAAAIKREDAKQLRKANTLAPGQAGRSLLWQASRLEQQADAVS